MTTKTMVKVTITDYDAPSPHNVMVKYLDKLPSSVGFDGGRVDIEGLDTLFLSNDVNVEWEIVEVQVDENGQVAKPTN